VTGEESNVIPYDPFADLTRKPGEWDLGIDFMKAKKYFEHKLRTEKSDRRYSKYAIMLIQLTNASRVSEAVEAFNRFLETGKRELWVRVRKKKGNDLRRMLIPSTVEHRGVPCTAATVKMFAKRRCGINTHSLRYALIGYLSFVKKQPPQIIAKMTHHSKLDMILKYTQQRLADELLDETAR